MGAENHIKDIFFDMILSGITSLYTGAFIIDLDDDALYRICHSGDSYDIVREDYGYTDYARVYAEKAIVAEHQEMFIKQSSPEYLREILVHGSDRIRFEYRIKSKGEALGDRWLRVSMALVDKKNGVASKVFFLVNDISSDKFHNTVHEALATDSDKAELEVARKAYEAKSLFLSNMSHDIRTPLNGIIGLLDIEERNMGDVDKQLECHDKIRMASEHLLSLLNDVMDMNRLESGAMVFDNEHINLSELVDDCVMMSTIQANERSVTISRHRNIKVKHPYVMSSSVHIRQILLNIISNAIKFNKANGRIDVYMREEEFTGDGVLMSFIVQDTGIGMSQVFLSNIFEPFTQANPDDRSQFNGTGLGMSIVKATIDKMGGFIDIQSQPGTGSRVTVTLPFTVDSDPVLKQPVAPKEVPNIAGLNILIVEDNDLNMEIARFIIEDAGAHPTLAWNGQEAVEVFKSSKPGTFDCILMDLMMPVIDGYKATRIIRGMDRADAKAIPIIAMTANAFAEDAKRCMQEGMNEHVSKPINPESVARAIVRHVGRQ